MTTTYYLYIFKLQNLLKRLNTKNIVIIIFILLPLNLGKHLITKTSFVNGLLIDYLIPTTYIQDVLIIFLLIHWVFFTGFKKEFTKVLVEHREAQLLVLFLAAVLLSVLSSQRFIPSFYAFGRVLLYALFGLYMTTKIKLDIDLSRFLKIAALTIVFLGILATLQFIKQSSVFNNYLILGEQPYSFSTAGIIKENLFGFSVVPAYGLFKHPNILGGFLSITLIWVCYLILYVKPGTPFSRKIYIGTFVLGFFGLLSTFSVFSYTSTFLGLLCVLLLNKFLLIKKIGLWLLATVFILSLIFPFLSQFQNSSLYRRAYLLEASYKEFRLNPLFGVGLNNSTLLIEKYLPYMGAVRFVQPPHNIFALLLAESGVFAFILFISLLWLTLKKAQHPLLFISLTQLIFLGCFDHYLFTIHQTQLLFWIVLSLNWTSYFKS